MKQVIECAYCDGKAQLQKENRVLKYRKEDFNVIEHFYKCNSCNEEFTTTESDTVTLLQTHNQYREQHHIPFPEEIIGIRDNYELSAKKMSEVLGLGVNGYSNYEKGEIPKPAIGNLISTSSNPIVFKTMLLKAKEVFSENSFKKVLNRLDLLIDNDKRPEPFFCKIDLYDTPNSFTGYRKPNKERIANTLMCFIQKGNKNFNDKLKLNKLLFYADFYSYNLYGQSITGLSYRAIDYGPVPTFYDNLYTFFENENFIESKWIKVSKNSAKEVFITKEKFDKSIFSKNEILIIEMIAEKFKDSSSWDLVDLSHTEKGWIDLNTQKQVLNYQKYAFELSGI